MSAMLFFPTLVLVSSEKPAAARLFLVHMSVWRKVLGVKGVLEATIGCSLLLTMYRRQF